MGKEPRDGWAVPREMGRGLVEESAWTKPPSEPGTRAEGEGGSSAAVGDDSADGTEDVEEVGTVAAGSDPGEGGVSSWDLEEARTESGPATPTAAYSSGQPVTEDKGKKKLNIRFCTLYDSIMTDLEGGGVLRWGPVAAMAQQSWE